MALPCSICKSVCCDSLVIAVTSFDVERIARHTGMRPWQFAHLRKLDLNVYNNDHVVECWEGKNREDYILALKSMPCRLRSEKGCSVYEARPMVCRLYPHLKTGEVSARAVCHLIPRIMFKVSKPDLLHMENFEKENAKYSVIVRECNRKRLTKEKAFEMLTNFRIY